MGRYESLYGPGLRRIFHVEWRVDILDMGY